MSASSSPCYNPQSPIYAEMDAFPYSLSPYSPNYMPTSPCYETPECGVTPSQAPDVPAVRSEPVEPLMPLTAETDTSTVYTTPKTTLTYTVLGLNGGIPLTVKTAAVVGTEAVNKLDKVSTSSGKKGSLESAYDAATRKLRKLLKARVVMKQKPKWNEGLIVHAVCIRCFDHRVSHKAKCGCLAYCSACAEGIMRTAEEARFEKNMERIRLWKEHRRQCPWGMPNCDECAGEYLVGADLDVRCFGCDKQVWGFDQVLRRGLRVRKPKQIFTL